MPIRVTGIGAALPTTAVSNNELATTLDTSDRWIRTRTGIGRRWIADESESSSTLAVAAARRALMTAGASSVDLLILATSTPDRSIPATAPLVAHELGLHGIPAFDVNAVCTGFLYALTTAHALLSAQNSDTALVIGADVFSSILNPHDRSTRSIFGDGAGAVVIERGALDHISSRLGADGTGYDLITRPSSGSAHSRDHSSNLAPYFTLVGASVFFQAITRMTDVCRELLADTATSTNELDLFVAHQANSRILDAVVDQLGIPPSKAYSNIEHVGNTVAASIPIALRDAHEAKLLKHGSKILLTAFGGGLTWGASLIEWHVDDISQETEERNTEMNIIERLAALGAEKMGVTEDELKSTASFADLGLDSLALLEFNVAIQKDYDVRLGEDDIAPEHTLFDVEHVVLEAQRKEHA